MDEEDLLEGISPSMKELLKSIPKRKKPGRNEPCPCGSNKKFKKCCLGKSFEEIDSIRHNRERNQIIEDIEKTVEDNSFMVLELDKYMFHTSTVYGDFKTKEWGLYFSRNQIFMSDKDFQHVFSEITEFLENLPEIEFRTNIIINQDDSSIKEFELLFLAFKKEYVLYVLNKTNFPVSDNLSLVYVLCQDVAYKIYKFLESIGHTTSYPRPMEKDEDLKRYAEEMNREFFLELRSAQKLLYMTTIIHEIKKKCGSPIEEELGIRLAEDNIPFVQQIGITEDYPLDSKKHIFTYPDFLIPVPFEPIAIYCDGQAYHEKTAEQATHDKRIDRKLQELGFVVLRFTGIEIRNNLERCVAEVKRHYLGEEYTKTPNEILIKNLTQIDKELLSEWERNFYESMWDYAKQEKPSSIKQERIIKRLMDKTKKHYELSE